MRKTKTLLIIFSFVVLTALYIVFIYGYFNAQKNKILNKNTEKLELSYLSVTNSLTNYSEIFLNEIIRNDKVLKIMSESINASKTLQDELRDSLYFLLIPKYEYLKTKNIKQLHFHLDNNESFLRFHRPHKYGDDLTNIRYSVKMANLNKKSYSGFEEGRIFNGFRYVVPLFDDYSHIGSVEASFSFSAIKDHLYNLGYKDVGFMLEKNIVEQKVFESELANYIPSLLSEDYLHEIQFLHFIDSSNNIFTQIDNQIKNDIKDYIENKSSFSVSTSFKNNNYIITFISIKNVEGTPVAYLFSYENNNSIYLLKKQATTLMIVGVIMLLLITLFIVKNLFNNIKIKDMNHKLVVEEEKYRTVADFNSDWEYWIDNDNNFKYVSPSCQRITGFSPDEFYANSKLMQNIIYHKDKDIFINHKHTINENGERNFIEFRIITKNNKIEWIDHHCQNVYNKKGENIGIRGSNRLITDRKKIEADFRDLSLLNNTIIAQAPIGILTFDKDGFCVSYNLVIEKIFKNQFDCGTEINYQNEPIFETTGLKAVIQNVINENVIKKNSFTLKNKHGKIVWILCNIVPLSKNEKAKILLLFEDITEQKLSESALKDSEELFRIITTNAKDAIVLINKYDEVVFWNKAAVNIFGYSLDEIKGQKLHVNIMPKKYSQTFKEGFKRYKETGEGNAIDKTVEMKGRKKNGEEFIAEISLAKVIIKNELHAIGIVRDITVKKRVEENLRDANLTKDKFFNIIAHDLKNPFNAIIGFSELIVNEFDNLNKDKIKQYISLIYQSGNNTYKLLENLLDWSRAQTGKIIFLPSELIVEHFFIDVVKLVNNSAKEKNILVSYEVESSITVLADDNMFKTILRNLLNNAIKFTNQNGAVKLSATQRETDVLFKVEDNGVGMNALTISKLFKIEEKISLLGTNAEKGTGLGLLLCKEFVEKHNGKIWAESELEVGSKFMFTLPK